LHEIHEVAGLKQSAKQLLSPLNRVVIWAASCGRASVAALDCHGECRTRAPPAPWGSPGVSDAHVCVPVPQTRCMPWPSQGMAEGGPILHGIRVEGKEIRRTSLAYEAPRYANSVGTVQVERFGRPARGPSTPLRKSVPLNRRPHRDGPCAGTVERGLRSISLMDTRGKVHPQFCFSGRGHLLVVVGQTHSTAIASSRRGACSHYCTGAEPPGRPCSHTPIPPCFCASAL